LTSSTGGVHTDVEEFRDSDAGNIVALAVAFVIGVAFAAVVNSFVTTW
jgi:large-conductance mechanosensitive channel